MGETHVVQGDTFKHKDAIRAAGGKWNAAAKEWEVPAGVELPGALTAIPLSRTARGRQEKMRAAVEADGVMNEVLPSSPVVISDIAHKGQPADARAASHALKNINREAIDGGVRHDAIADELLGAGWPRETVVGWMRGRLESLPTQTDYLAPDRIRREVGRVTAWLSANGGAA